MLINFRTENYLSFDKNTTFSMTLGDVRSHTENILTNKNINLLKFAAIYGANASGKSSFVSAIKVSKEIIVNGTDNLLISDSFNKNSPKNIDKETKFEYEILLKNIIYSYGFSINLNRNEIRKEWLYDITKDETEIFTRDNKISINFDYLNLSEENKNRLNVYSSDVESSGSSLFLTFLNRNNIKEISEKSIFSNIYQWFSNNLEVISPEEATSDFGLTYHNEKYLSQLSTFLEANDTGITKVLFEKSDERMRGIPQSLEKKLLEQITKDLAVSKTKGKKGNLGAIVRLPKNIYKFQNNDGVINMYVVKFEHNGSKTKYRFDEESDGTRRLIELFSIVSNLKNNKVFIVDELDRSLHPLLTHNFVASFLNNSSSSQLIVTTHEDRLLDLSLLRRDQIWFVKKDDQGNSSLYSLEEFKERFDKNIMNAYLNGRYGATPNTFNYFTSLNSIVEEN